MINKFKTIENLGVFQKFKWDNKALDKKKNIIEFKDINILYGWNYSGKTTLSRIIRAMETGEISDKYKNPNFCVSFEDGTTVDQNNLTSHSENIRVFNEDFVRRHLKFISNPDDGVESFAIAESGNIEILKEVYALNKELGSNKEGEKTELYAKLERKSNNYLARKNEYEEAKKSLKNKLSTEAKGIKDSIEKYGEPNYNIRKLESEIEQVLNQEFDSITNEQKFEKEKLI
ncbi:unnamed protein product, partial [marine sediment metagenome]